MRDPAISPLLFAGGKRRGVRVGRVPCEPDMSVPLVVGHDPRDPYHVSFPRLVRLKRKAGIHYFPPSIEGGNKRGVVGHDPRDPDHVSFPRLVRLKRKAGFYA